MTERTKGTLLLSIAYFALGVLGVESRVAASDQYCPDCLEKGLHQNFSETYSFIKTAWQQYVQASQALKEIEDGGASPQLVEEAKASWRVTRDNWEEAERLADVYSSPRFITYLNEEQSQAESLLQGKGKQLTRVNELYKRVTHSTFGPQRQGLVADISGYEREAKQLKRTFEADMVSAGFETVVSAVDTGLDYAIKRLGNHLAADASKESLSPLLALLEWGQAQHATTAHAIGVVRDGLEVQMAYNEDASLKAYASAVHLGADGALRVADLIARTPKGPELLGTMAGPLASRASLYASVLSLLLDIGMTDAALSRLEEADKRQATAEVSEERWRQRVKLAGIEVNVGRRRVALASQAIAEQQRLTSLYHVIRSDTSAVIK